MISDNTQAEPLDKTTVSGSTVWIFNLNFYNVETS